MVRGLRLSLAVQAAAVVLPIAIGVVVAVGELTNKMIGSCAGDDSCARAAPALLFGPAFMLGGPAWWTISGARRAVRLTSRQLAWLVAVDLYLLVVGLWLWALARATVNEQPPPADVTMVVTASALVATALLSVVACGARMLELSRRPRSTL